MNNDTPIADNFLPIDTAPTDGTEVLVYVAALEDLPAFEVVASYHEDAGWTVDELRNAVGWKPLPHWAKAAIYTARMHWDAKLTCGCSDSELLVQLRSSESRGITLAQLTGFDESVHCTPKMQMNALRAQHTLRLDGVHRTGASCPNPRILRREAPLP